MNKLPGHFVQGRHAEPRRTSRAASEASRSRSRTLPSSPPPERKEDRDEGARPGVSGTPDRAAARTKVARAATSSNRKAPAHPGLEDETRAHLADSFVKSTLLFNAGTWDALPPPPRLCAFDCQCRA